jgi:hypothetical protein
MARLRPAQDGQRTVVTVALSSGGDAVLTALVHEGSCDDLGDPVFTLNDVEAGRSRSRIATSYDQLRVGGYAIALHPSPDAVDETTVCGDIEADAD